MKKVDLNRMMQLHRTAFDATVPIEQRGLAMRCLIDDVTDALGELEHLRKIVDVVRPLHMNEQLLDELLDQYDGPRVQSRGSDVS